jgi:predicted branched-subunit amino acid permease
MTIGDWLIPLVVSCALLFVIVIVPSIRSRRVRIVAAGILVLVTVVIWSQIDNNLARFFAAGIMAVVMGWMLFFGTRPRSNDTRAGNPR